MLEVKDLSIEFAAKHGMVTAVRDLSFELKAGETLGIVGESGCGKSITNLAIMGLLPKQAKVSAKKLSFEGRNLLAFGEKEWQQLRGREIGMIFQDPMSALNPCFTVEQQIIETIRVHNKLSKKDAEMEALSLMEQVGIPAPKERLKSYPHELSGGMAQRVMIAMAISSNPKLLIADEPTTALDVTIQDQILRLLRDLQNKKNMALILVTHDLGVVAQNTSKIQVMYAGEVVEAGPTSEVIGHPTHPYTVGLLAGHPSHSKETIIENQSANNLEHKRPRLPSIQGMVPDLKSRPSGCQFHPRCFKAQENCHTSTPHLNGQDHLNVRQVRCFYPVQN